MRILCTGDRDWTNKFVVWMAFMPLQKDTVIIHGAARGLDTIAAQCALELGLQIDLPPTPENEIGGYPADWTKYRRGAGPIRNSQMLKQGMPDEVWAWHDNLWLESKGTKNMVDQALLAGLPVTLFTTNAPPIKLVQTPLQTALPLLPNHPGKCECEACNDAYGKRRATI